jgi:alkanesulfonate monooxygenase SsuD/methylene tetrahydromethanopterin reductase-like flavin-dependent oxidoreductase (luciferase family)
MKFGVTVVPRVSDWKLFVDLEAMGYDAAWAADSQMLYSDAYATLALAAVNTSRIRLGTGVSVAGVRLAPVTAHSIATINKLAPGRTFLGIGTGHTAMRVMGKDPVKARDFREYLRVLRALLHGQEVDYALADGERTDIRFLHPDQGFIDVEHPVPIYVAADGPLALKTAGAYGDGRGLLTQPDQGAPAAQPGDDARGSGRGRPHAAGRLLHRRAELRLCAAARREHDLGPRDRRDRADGRRHAALLVGALPEGRRHQHGGRPLP